MANSNNKPEQISDTMQATFELMQKLSGHSRLIPYGSPDFDFLVGGISEGSARTNAKNALIETYNRAFPTDDIGYFYKTLAKINTQYDLYKNDAFQDLFKKSGIKPSSPVITGETDFLGLTEKLETLTDINEAVQSGTLAVVDALKMYAAINYSERLFKITKPQREYLADFREAFSLDRMDEKLRGHELFGYVRTNISEEYENALNSLGIEVSTGEEPAEGAEDTRVLTPEMQDLVKLANGIPLFESREHVSGVPEEFDYTKITEEPSSLSNVGMRNIESAARNVQSYLFGREVAKSIRGISKLTTREIPEAQHDTVVSLLSFDKTATIDDVRTMVDMYAKKITDLTKVGCMTKDASNNVVTTGIYDQGAITAMYNNFMQNSAFSVSSESEMIYHITKYVATHPVKNETQCNSKGEPIQGETLFVLDENGNVKLEPVDPLHPEKGNRPVTTNSSVANPDGKYAMTGLAFVDGQILDCLCKVKVVEGGKVEKVDPTPEDLKELTEHFRKSSFLPNNSSEVKPEDIAFVSKDTAPTIHQLLTRQKELEKNRPAGFDEYDTAGTLEVRKPTSSPEFNIGLYRSTSYYQQAKAAMLAKLQQYCPYSYEDFACACPEDAYVSVAEATAPASPAPATVQDPSSPVLKVGAEMTFNTGDPIQPSVSTAAVTSVELEQGM